MALDDILSGFDSWKSCNEHFTMFEYLCIKCNCEQIAIVSKLFFPDVIISSGCFFLKDSRQACSLSGFFEGVTTAEQLERVINFICFGNFFPYNDENTNREMTFLLKDIWEMYFSKKYKELNLIVDAYEDEYDGWSITVYQKENINRPKPDITKIANIKWG